MSDLPPLSGGSNDDPTGENPAPPPGGAPPPPGGAPPPPGGNVPPPGATPPPPGGAPPPPGGNMPPPAPPQAPQWNQQAPGAPGMPPPQPQYGATAAPQGTNGLAVASLILGILSFFCVGLLAGPLAVILGFLGRKKANEEMGGNGAGMALGGIITGLIGFLLSGMLFLTFFVWTDNVADEIQNNLDTEINSDPSDGECDFDRFLQDPDC